MLSFFRVRERSSGSFYAMIFFVFRKLIYANWPDLVKAPRTGVRHIVVTPVDVWGCISVRKWMIHKGENTVTFRNCSTIDYFPLDPEKVNQSGISLV